MEPDDFSQDYSGSYAEEAGINDDYSITDNDPPPSDGGEGYNQARYGTVAPSPKDTGIFGGGGAGDFGLGGNNPSKDREGNNTYLNEQMVDYYTKSRGATATNPFPESFFSQLMGVEKVNYVKLMGKARVQELNELRARQAFNLPTLSSMKRAEKTDGTYDSSQLKEYGSGDYYIGQNTNMGEVKPIPSTARDFMNFMPAGGIINALTGQPGLPEYSQEYKKIMDEKAKSANETGIINRISNIGTDIGDSLSKTGGAIEKNVNAVSDYIGNMVNKSKGLGSGIFSNSNKEIDKVLSDYKEMEKRAKENIAKGSGQFGVSDDRSFDAFGNVKGSSLDTKDEFSSEKDPAGYHTVINPLTGQKQLRYNKNMPYEERADVSSIFNNIGNFTDKAVGPNGYPVFGDKNLRFKLGFDKNQAPGAKVEYKTNFFG